MKIWRRASELSRVTQAAVSGLGGVVVTRAFPLMAVALTPVVARAQSVFDSVRTASGVCYVWQMPVGGSDFPQDASYSRCALDRLPVHRETPMPPPPRFATDARASYMVIVNADGTVDPDRSRGMTRGGDTVFYREALETIRRWRFDPGRRGGKPVRSAFAIELVSDSRVDTIPSRLEWEYRAGPVSDTLLGRWVREAPLPAFTQSQVDSVHVAMVRRLVRMQVILPRRERRYCVIVPRADSADQTRATRLLAQTMPALATSLAPNGCERTPGMLRLVLPPVHHTEGGRGVVNPSGDFLANWPPGYDGSSWRAWRGRCIADVPTRTATVAIDCGVNPDYAPDEMLAWRERHPEHGRPRPALAYAAGDSVRVTILATTNGAYMTDTLRSTIRSLPELDERAVRDADLPCGGWSVHSSQAGEIYVVSGDPSSASMFITQATTRPTPDQRGRSMQCGPQEPRTTQFAAFLLGGLGDRATAPVTLCYSRCARAYGLDPARHTLAEDAHVRFRVADLRADTRMGDNLIFRIIVEPAPRSLLPIVIIRSQNRWPTSAWLPRRVASNAWDYTVLRADGFTDDDEVYVYLIARDK